MKILAKYIATSTQIHNGKCYFIGITSDYDTTVNNIEASGTAATTNQIAQLRKDGEVAVVILPKPGIECSNGLYVGAEGRTTVYYSIA